MQIKIGDNLKKLRTKNELTQEKLADIIGVSPQAISRWENYSTFPDIQLLPAIATYFMVSVDELLGMDEIRGTEEINRIYTRVHNYEKEGLFNEAIVELRNALKSFPNDYGFMSELALALTMANDKDDIKLYDEAISLSICVLSSSTEDKLRSTTKANLCYLYKKVNNHQLAVETTRNLSHVWESRELIIPEIVETKDYEIKLKEGINTCVDVLYEKISMDLNTKLVNASRTLALGRSIKEEVSLDEKIDLIKKFLKNN